MKIVPRTVKGMRDFLPDEMRNRNYLISKFREIFEKFGFEPLETPVMEYLDILTGKYGTDGEKLMYNFQDRAGREIGLKYDLTVPLARIIAQYTQIIKPFKRYQIQPVYRYDNPQKGRYREFYQCDIDIIGTSSIMADAECLSVCSSVLTELGFKDFLIRINNRIFLNTLLSDFGFSDSDKVIVLRLLDKKKKVSIEKLNSEALEKGLNSDNFNKLITLLSESEADPVSFLERLRESGTTEGIKGLLELYSFAISLGVKEQNIKIDLSLARGLDYYTSLVWEAEIIKPEIGSVVGGGRYDTLVERFSKEKIPCVGISFGFERICFAMKELNMFPMRKEFSGIFITIFNKDTLQESIYTAYELRRSGIPCELYLDEKKLKQQFKYASRKKFKWVIIIGPDEIALGKVVIRDLENSKEEKIDQSSLINFFTNYNK